MEENVALDSTKQKQFVKSLKGIKKLLTGNDDSKVGKKDTVKTGRVKKSKKERGLVYLSHIPHGFYEHQMTEYFKQFGVVTNARVIRSAHTGMSKGHAFVEFKDPNVAQIVAETMNNYLMGKRLIKAALIPPEKQRRFAKRKNWNAQNNPGNDLRQKMKKAHNSLKDNNEELKIARKLLSNLNKTKKKLREMGIDYDFFTPIDVPESLLDQVKVTQESDSKTIIETKKEKKDKVKQDIAQKNKKSVKSEAKDDLIVRTTSADKKAQKSKGLQQSNARNNFVKAPTDDSENNSKESKARIKKAVKKDMSSVTQIQKEKKLKEADVSPPENFIETQQDSDDESDEDLDEDITSEEDESVQDDFPPPKRAKGPTPLIQGRQAKKQKGNKPSPAGKSKPPHVPGPQVKKGNTPLQPVKIMPQKEKKVTTKPKFEKKGKKKPLNKVITKK